MQRKGLSIFFVWDTQILHKKLRVEKSQEQNAVPVGPSLANSLCLSFLWGLSGHSSVHRKFGSQLDLYSINRLADIHCVQCTICVYGVHGNWGDQNSRTGKSRFSIIWRNLFRKQLTVKSGWFHHRGEGALTLSQTTEFICHFPSWLALLPLTRSLTSLSFL